MKKTSIAFIFLFLFLLPTTVFAGNLAQGSWGTNLTWILDDDGTLTLSGEGKMEDGHYASNLPIGGPWVTVWRRTISRVVVEEGLTSIGKYAFYSCSALREVILPSSITSIEEGAFRECTGLEDITIPRGVKTIHHTAFNQCTALQNIYVNASNRFYSSMDGVLCNKDRTALLIFPYMHGNSDTYIIPEGIVEIGDNAFYENKRLIHIRFPSTLKRINGQCFYACSYLKNVELPYGLEYIGYSAFRYCNSMTSVNIPSSIKEMNSYAFGSCNLLTSASFGEGIQKIPDSIFYVCKNLDTVYIPKSVALIETSAFSDCNNLSDVYYGGSEQDWGNITFRNFNDVLNFSWVIKHYQTGLTDISSGKLSLSQTVYVYDGKAKRPEVIVELPGKEIYDYVVTYLHNVEVGTAEVIVSGMGSFTGTIRGSFEIKAAPTPTSTPTPTSAPTPTSTPKPTATPTPTPTSTSTSTPKPSVDNTNSESNNTNPESNSNPGNGIGTSKPSPTIKVSKTKVKYGKSTITITSNSGSKLYVYGINWNSRNGVTIKNGKVAKIKFTKFNKRGKYTFEVMSPLNANFNVKRKKITIWIK